MFLSIIHLCYSLPMFSLPQISMPKRQQESKELILRERRIFARNLKHARIEAGLTQEGLSKATGLTQPFLSDVENAKSTINLDNANVIASAVGKPLSQLLSPVKK